MTRRAFTLVELLVVVTIIVLLMAIMSPAMDRAIYQAQLAVCGSQLKAIATMASNYAMGSRRHYPHRPALRDPEISMYQPTQLTWFAPDRRYDDRPTLRPYTALRAFNCPLSGRFDVDTRDPDSFVYSNYVLWFGYYYTTLTPTAPVGVPTSPSPTASRVPQRGLVKLGDRWEFYGESYPWLAGDQDFISFAFGAYSTWGAHPDKADQSYNTIMQDTPSVAFTAGKNPAGKYATSVWLGPRGPVDINFASSDCAVLRFNDVPGPGVAYNKRFAHAGQYNGSNPGEAAGSWNTTPRG